ncbi:MAG: adenylosuccinate lyase, partial [Candidatus Omnitrophica bacterium]|nr:adenylosuccinate lyase [Candidatus Omnitrophota bacterium]
RCAMKVWDENVNFKETLWNDKDFIKIIRPREIEELFDLGYYTRHVDRIFKKVGI